MIHQVGEVANEDDDEIDETTSSKINRFHSNITYTSEELVNPPGIGNDNNRNNSSNNMVVTSFVPISSQARSLPKQINAPTSNIFMQPINVKQEAEQDAVGTSISHIKKEIFTGYIEHTVEEDDESFFDADDDVEHHINADDHTGVTNYSFKNSPRIIISTSGSSSLPLDQVQYSSLDEEVSSEKARIVISTTGSLENPMEKNHSVIQLIRPKVEHSESGLGETPIVAVSRTRGRPSILSRKPITFKYKCPKCEDFPATLIPSKLQEHIKSAHQEDQNLPMVVVPWEPGLNNEDAEGDLDDNDARKACDLCNKVYKINFLPIHMWRSHQIKIERDSKFDTMSTCEMCAKRYKASFLPLHLWRVHKIKMEKSPGKQLKNLSKCELCQKAYKPNFLVLHQMREHGIKPIPNKEAKLMCPDMSCGLRVHTQKDLRQHIHIDHNIQVEEVELSFPCKSDFEEWLEQEETNTNSQFAKSTGQKLSNKNGKMTVYYACRRSGTYRSQGSGRRNLKAQGSCKTGRSCPASLKVIMHPEGEVDVKYCKTHFGHQLELAHTTHKTSFKQSVASLLMQGFTKDKVLDAIRQANAENPERKHLVKRKDLHNIAKTYGIDSQVGQDPNNLVQPNAMESEAILQALSKPHISINRVRDIAQQAAIKVNKLVGKNLSNETIDSLYKAATILNKRCQQALESVNGIKRKSHSNIGNGKHRGPRGKRIKIEEAVGPMVDWGTQVLSPTKSNTTVTIKGKMVKSKPKKIIEKDKEMILQLRAVDSILLRDPGDHEYAAE